MMGRGVRHGAEEADFGTVPALGEHGSALREEFATDAPRLRA